MKIAISSDFSKGYLARYIDGFYEKYPNITLDIQVRENDVDFVKNRFDLQIKTSDIKAPDLISKKIVSTKQVVCTSASYLQKIKKIEKPEDLYDVNCVMFGDEKVWEFENKKDKKLTKLNVKDAQISKWKLAVSIPAEREVELMKIAGVYWEREDNIRPTSTWALLVESKENEDKWFDYFNKLFNDASVNPFPSYERYSIAKNLISENPL